MGRVGTPMLSVGTTTIEHMSESAAPEARLLERAAAAARDEARAAAARLSAVGEFVDRRSAAVGSATDEWLVDVVSAAAAEVAAALRISHGLAEWQIRYAHAMRHQLPALAARFAAGEVSEMAFKAAVYRTGLITDPDLLARVDAALANLMPRWGTAGRSDLSARIDAVVARSDRDAVRRREDRRAARGMSSGPVDAGLTEITAVVYAPDGRAFSNRVRTLANTVCPNDPRTFAERLSDAFGAIGYGWDRLPCRCGGAECAATAGGEQSSVVIHVVTDAASLSSSSPRAGTGGVMHGHDGLLPPDLLVELAKHAALRPVTHPGGAAPEPRYRPSRALAEFVRCRDLTCRFPNCATSAWACDVDHTVPWGDGGTTHASNLKSLCRLHHLLKTFWGWHDEQLPDGRVVWTSPHGRTYVTRADGAMHFGGLAAPTAPAPAPRPAPERCGDKSVLMPRRQRSRTQQRSADVAAQRRANLAARTTRKPLHDHVEDYHYDETFLENREPIPPPY